MHTLRPYRTPLVLAALVAFTGLRALAAPRDTRYVTVYQGKYYGIFDPNVPAYHGDLETITPDIVKQNIANFDQLNAIPYLKQKSIEADPSLGALLDNTTFYSALATRYRYEPLMEGEIPQQEPPPGSFFAQVVRHQSQTSALARGVRNRFRTVERLVGQVLEDLPRPVTVGNLGGGSGDDISVGVFRWTQGQPTSEVTQNIYDIDAAAMGLGVELGRSYYHYPVTAQTFNLIDLGALDAAAGHLRQNGVRWINSIGFFMEYNVEKSPGVWMTPADKERVFANFCRGGVTHITFSAFTDPTNPLPAYIVKQGWKSFDLNWTHDSVVAMMKRAGYELVSRSPLANQLYPVYYFRGNCP